jgi:DNA repair exonuclease SbcCD ATPase subunit
VRDLEARIKELVTELEAVRNESECTCNEARRQESKLAETVAANQELLSQLEIGKTALVANSTEIEALKASLLSANTLIGTLRSKSVSQEEMSKHLEEQLKDEHAAYEDKLAQQQIRQATHDLATKFVFTSEENVVEHIKDEKFKKETHELHSSLDQAKATIDLLKVHEVEQEQEIRKDVDIITNLTSEIGSLKTELTQIREENHSLSSKVLQDEELIRQSRCVSPEREVELNATISELSKQLEQTGQLEQRAVSTIESLTQQVDEARAAEKLSLEKYHELLTAYRDFRMKSKDDYDKLKKQHIDALQSLTTAIEAGGEGPSKDASEGMAHPDSGGHSAHAHHVKFADMTPHIEEAFDDPLMQRLVADVKIFTDHMHDVERQLEKEHVVEEEIQKTSAKKQEALTKEIEDLQARLKDLTKDLSEAKELVEKEKQAERTLEHKLEAVENELGAELALEEHIKEESLEREHHLDDEVHALRRKLEAHTLLSRKREDTSAEQVAQLRSLEAQHELLMKEHAALQVALAELQALHVSTLVANTKLEEENRQLTDTAACFQTTEAIASNESSAPPQQQNLQPYLEEIASLEQELTQLRSSSEGFQLVEKSKNEELLRVIHTLKCALDDSVNSCKDLDKELAIKSRNAHDAETQELQLLQQVRDVQAERDVAIHACDLLKTQIMTLATTLSGVQAVQSEMDIEASLQLITNRVVDQESNVTTLQEHVTNLDRMQAGLMQTIASLKGDILGKDNFIRSLRDQLQHARVLGFSSSEMELPAEAPAAAMEAAALGRAPAAVPIEDPATAGAETDTRLYLVTIQDLQEQMNESKAALMTELLVKQKELEVAKRSIQAMTTQIANIRAAKDGSVALNYKTIQEEIISKLAVDMAARVESTAVVKTIGQKVLGTLQSELVETKKELEIALSRPQTADVDGRMAQSRTPNPTPVASMRVSAGAISATPSAQILVVNAFAEATELTRAITSAGERTFDDNTELSSTWASEYGPYVPPSQQPRAGNDQLQDTMMSMTYEEEDEIFNPSRVLPKIGARNRNRAVPASRTNDNVDADDKIVADDEQLDSVSVDASGRVASPNLEDAIRSFYTPQKKIGDKRRGKESVGSANARAKAASHMGSTSAGVPQNANTLRATPRGNNAEQQEHREFSTEEITQYCDVEIAKDKERGEQFVASLAGRDTEIAELRQEVYSVQQALSTARGEIVFKIVQLHQLEAQFSSLQQDHSETKQLLAHANEKIRMNEVRREQIEEQKHQADEKVADGLKLARKYSELEGQLFDTHHALKITHSELEKSRAALQEALYNANAKYRVKFLGSNEKVRRGMRSLQVT